MQDAALKIKQTSQKWERTSRQNVLTDDESNEQDISCRHSLQMKH